MWCVDRGLLPRSILLPPSCMPSSTTALVQVGLRWNAAWLPWFDGNCRIFFTNLWSLLLDPWQLVGKRSADSHMISALKVRMNSYSLSDLNFTCKFRAGGPSFEVAAIHTSSSAVDAVVYDGSCSRWVGLKCCEATLRSEPPKLIGFARFCRLGFDFCSLEDCVIRWFFNAFCVSGTGQLCQSIQPT